MTSSTTTGLNQSPPFKFGVFGRRYGYGDPDAKAEFMLIEVQGGEQARRRFEESCWADQLEGRVIRTVRDAGISFTVLEPRVVIVPFHDRVDIDGHVRWCDRVLSVAWRVGERWHPGRVEMPIPVLFYRADFDGSPIAGDEGGVPAVSSYTPGAAFEEAPVPLSQLLER